LILSVLACLLLVAQHCRVYYFLICFGFLGWIVDHIIRILIDYTYFEGVESNERKQRR
jgi:hypothetical protein